MKLTKYEHSCVVLEEKGIRLIIDPGEFTKDFGGADNVAAVVVTHVHGDHLNIEHLQAIVAANPQVKVFTTQEVTSQWVSPHAVAVKNGMEQSVGPFMLRFYGGLHAEIHSFAPRNQNIGVLVNDAFYYPGDSLDVPDRAITTLALPAGAPWLKTGEAIDCMKTINPKVFFRTHDGLLNDRGLATTDRWYQMASEQFGPAYKPLSPGDSIELN